MMTAVSPRCTTAVFCGTEQFVVLEGVSVALPQMSIELVYFSELLV